MEWWAGNNQWAGAEQSTSQTPLNSQKRGVFQTSLWLCALSTFSDPTQYLEIRPKVKQKSLMRARFKIVRDRPKVKIQKA